MVPEQWGMALTGKNSVNLRIALKWSKINFFAVRKLFHVAVTILFDFPHAQLPCHVPKRYFAFTRNSVIP
jgi:hypothetical protein